MMLFWKTIACLASAACNLGSFETKACKELQAELPVLDVPPRAAVVLESCQNMTEAELGTQQRICQLHDRILATVGSPRTPLELLNLNGASSRAVLGGGGGTNYYEDGRAADKAVAEAYAAQTGRLLRDANDGTDADADPHSPRTRYLRVVSAVAAALMEKPVRTMYLHRFQPSVTVGMGEGETIVDPGARKAALAKLCSCEM